MTSATDVVPHVLKYVSQESASRSALAEFQKEYRAALDAYLKGQSDEDALMLAYDLGRRGAARQLSILNLSEIHQSAILSADLDVKSRPGKEASQVMSKGAEFFCQVLATFEMMYRGYIETIAQLQQLNTTLKQQANALRHSEERMRLFIKHSPAAVAMLDRDLRYLLYSPRWLTDYRLGEQDLTGIAHYEVFPETPPAWRALHQRCLAGESNTCEEALFKRADGVIDYVRWEIHPWYTEQGDQQQIGGIIMFTEVITERKNQEKKIARMSRIRAIMSATNAAIVRIGERAELMREVCRIAVDHGKFDMAWIGFAESGTTRMGPAAAQAASTEAGPDGIPEERTLVERVLKTRATVVCNDIAHERRLAHKDEYLRRGYRSLVVFPLFAEEQPVGVLCLYAGEAGLFDRDEMKLLCELADDISFALNHFAKEERINYLAYYDALTDLPNRTLFSNRLQLQVELARRDQNSIAVTLLDFERFANVNDSYGRRAGDIVLKQAALRLKEHVSPRDTLSHIGGDRFALLLAGDVTAAEAAHQIERLLHDCFNAAFHINGHELYVSVKAGIAMFPNDGADHDLLIKNAEIALRKAKKSGEPYLFYRAEMNASVAKRLTLENRLYRALEREEFTLYYQPKVHTVSGRVVGLESLLRWNEPESGMVLPGAFIPILEETGMILHVGQWIMEKAIADHRRWASIGLAPPPIAVNVSVIQLRQRNFVEALKNMRDKIPDDGHILDLEITESIVMEDIDQNILKLRAAQDMGMKIAIDDFGTGYSSLSYLTKLPIDLLKIDRSFVLDMNQSASGLAIVSSVISLAHSLQLEVVAEGVDDKEQAKLLKLLNCDQMQGYLCSHPLPEKEVEALLAV